MASYDMTRRAISARPCVVGPGDTLYDIAMEYGTTVTALRRANGRAAQVDPGLTSLGFGNFLLYQSSWSPKALHVVSTYQPPPPLQAEDPQVHEGFRPYERALF